MTSVVQTALTLTGLNDSDVPLVPQTVPIVTDDGLYNAGGSLKRLYWFEGDPVGGPWVDDSGTGNNATKITGANPSNLSGGGLGIGTNGVAADTGLAIGATFTVAAIMKSTVSTAIEQYLAWWHASGIAYPVDPANSWPHMAGPYPALRTDNNEGVFIDESLDQINASPLLKVPSALGPANIACARFFRSDGPNGVVDQGVLGGGYVSWQSAALVNYYAAYSAVHHAFGLMPYGTIRPANGEYYAYAVWPVFVTDDYLRLTLRAMCRRVSARGTPIFNWNG